MFRHSLQDDDDQNQLLNSRTIKEFPEDSGTLVAGKDGQLMDGGTMIAHEDCGTLVPDSGTMVELNSNLGTMVINSDSEDSTMKSECWCRTMPFILNNSTNSSRTRHQSG